MKTHKQMDKYNAMLFSMPDYHDLTPNNKSYKEVCQQNGKEMNEMSWYILGVVTKLQRGGSSAQRAIFNHAIECPRALLEFDMYAGQKSQDDATLSYMEDGLPHFLNFNNVFVLGQPSKKAKAKANTLRMELVKKRMVHEATDPETWTPSKKRQEMNHWREYISHEIDVSKELDANFYFPKIHLMSYWIEHLCR
jgi:hypothetical protein